MPYPLFSLLSAESCSGYYTDLNDFNKCVEKDALEFKPFGQNIGSYKRHLGKGKGKGKALVPEMDLKEDDEDVVTFEIYNVSASYRAHLTCF